MNENNKVMVDFTYIDDFNDITSMQKEVNADYLDLTQLEVLCELFREFLLCAGFYYVKEIKPITE